MNHVFCFFALLLLNALTPSAFSAAVPAGSVQESGPKQPSARLKMDLYGWGYSNAFTKWDGRKAGPDGNSGDPIQFNTQIILSTPAFGSMSLTLVPQFVLQPFQGQRVQLVNPTVGVQGVVYENGGFSYWARYGVDLPLTASSRNEGMLISPLAIQTVAYRLPGTGFKLEASIVPSVNIYTNGQTSSFLYLSPRVYYLVNDSWWVVSILETYHKGNRGEGIFNLVGANPTNLGLGARYTSAGGKGLWVQPFLNLFPFGLVASTAHMGVFFGGPLL